MAKLVTQEKLILACIFATGFSGVVSEYVMATLASYLIGDSITQWAMTISVMLFFMGVGSKLSERLPGDPLRNFVICELILSLIVSFAPTLVYSLAAYTERIELVVYTLTSCLGILIGAEIPLASQILSRSMSLKTNIAWVLSQDYFGALVGGVFFVFLGKAYLGLAYTSVFLGALNLVVALSCCRGFPRLPVAATALLLLLNAAIAKDVVVYGEQSRYRDLIIWSEASDYQKIVLTQWKDDYWLYLNGNEQFSTVDEHKYHETLVHPTLNVSRANKRILILGGGDGLAAREILNFHPEVEEITVVDLDPGVTKLSQTHPVMLKINERSLLHSKVRIINQDAKQFLSQNKALYDSIIIDLPDPKTVSIARLYTNEFYSLARKSLSNGGCMATQALSPFYVPQAFWSIDKTLTQVGLSTKSYWISLPTLGDWGFVMGCRDQSPEMVSHRFLRTNIDNRFRFLDKDQLVAMQIFDKEIKIAKKEAQASNLFNLNVYKYYQKGRWDLY
ncbi:polyamine aminopropyltransferase [Pseudobacteriovorax antillogorgiicola]|uniref:Polyamine aminopropyltransferase n=1 Tax=Pseudobacteriovorax antillogorgiicola TaxID=1513793 RepID=A0A1Y6CR76_9BACT|nr:polyamine aminopropyltransferase [Pseudobacteriovorax antillogorgiicola]TCS41263.1 spermidine synthase [Pseudobacteriovorax antillogorgiicola]SMF83762.1 spermidine synthase [Pseudobacteriovorax antillogorgiicola]